MQIRDSWYVLKASCLRTVEKLLVYNFLPSKMHLSYLKYTGRRILNKISNEFSVKASYHSV